MGGWIEGGCAGSSKGRKKFGSISISLVVALEARLKIDGEVVKVGAGEVELVGEVGLRAGRSREVLGWLGISALGVCGASMLG